MKTELFLPNPIDLAESSSVDLAPFMTDKRLPSETSDDIRLVLDNVVTTYTLTGVGVYHPGKLHYTFFNLQEERDKMEWVKFDSHKLYPELSVGVPSDKVSTRKISSQA